MIERDGIRERVELLQRHLNERQVRLWAGAEARCRGWGGVTAVSEATGLSRTTVAAGIAELEAQEGTPPAAQRRTRIRGKGAGRKSLAETQPGLWEALEALLDPATRGHPESPLRWTTKSAAHLAKALREKGFKVSAETARRMLHYLGYSLQKTQKSREGTTHPDRDAQFQHIAAEVERHQAAGQPVISVDTKKKELVGEFANGGQEWQPFGKPEEVGVHDFPSAADGKAIPYGVYDQTANQGWVNVGISHDTAEFATESIARWWKRMGCELYPEARELLITADCGGSNSPRTRLWLVSLQELADRTGLTLNVCHFPPGTSKWNKIEHRLFAQISMNWRGRPLLSFEAIVNLIANTKTSTGLTVRAELDEGLYPKGKTIPDVIMKTLSLSRSDFHGDWNYTLEPRTET
jgi:transposase